MKLIDKLVTLCNLLRLKPYCKDYRTLRVYGRLGLRVFPGGSLEIGRRFQCNSGNMGNPMGRNVRTSIQVEKGASLIIGENVGVSSATIWCAERVEIGNHVKIGAMTIIADTDAHALDYRLRRSFETDWTNARTGAISIGEDAFIGAQCILCKGVAIGKRSIVGAGSVVTNNIPDDELWAGNPAHFIKKLNDR